jgi:hypothetical protein
MQHECSWSLSTPNRRSAFSGCVPTPSHSAREDGPARVAPNAGSGRTEPQAPRSVSVRRNRQHRSFVRCRLRALDNAAREPNRRPTSAGLGRSMPPGSSAILVWEIVDLPKRDGAAPDRPRQRGWTVPVRPPGQPRSLRRGGLTPGPAGLPGSVAQTGGVTVFGTGPGLATQRPVRHSGHRHRRWRPLADAGIGPLGITLIVGVLVMRKCATARAPRPSLCGGPERRTIEAGFASSRSPTSRWRRPGPRARLDGAQGDGGQVTIARRARESRCAPGS